MSANVMSDSSRMEAGLDLIRKQTRLADSELRILICTATYFVHDGVTNTIRNVEKHLRSRGAAVKILSTVSETVHIPPNGMEHVIEVPGLKIPFKNAGDYSLGIGLNDDTLRQIEEFKPNCVHFTVPDFVGLDGIRWCQKNNIAYIGTWHSNYTDYLKFYYLDWIMSSAFHQYLRGFFEQIPTVYIPTQYMLNKVCNDWGYGKATTLKQWGRGVDMDVFSPARRSEEFRLSKGIQPEDVAVVWVGRLVPEKRPDIWLKVVQRLQEEGLPVKPLVVGTGTFDRQLSKLRNVSCTGWLSGPALGEAYASSDILLFPSSVETFGNVTLEALSCGCPAIVEEECGGHLVKEGVNGLTCKVDDEDAFYQATRRLVKDTMLRKQMSVNAREGAFAFERNVILQQMAENYKDAIQNHADPAYLQKHLSVDEGAGRNFLARLCCEFYYIKRLLEPFLVSAGKTIHCLDNTGECMQTARTSLGNMAMSASHLSLSALASTTRLSSIEEGQVEVEVEDVEPVNDDDYDYSHRHSKQDKLCFRRGLTNFMMNLACRMTPNVRIGIVKIMYSIVMIFAVCMLWLLIYMCVGVNIDGR